MPISTERIQHGWALAVPCARLECVAQAHGSELAFHVSAAVFDELAEVRVFDHCREVFVDDEGRAHAEHIGAVVVAVVAEARSAISRYSENSMLLLSQARNCIALINIKSGAGPV
jgi:hypothetical protein